VVQSLDRAWLFVIAPDSWRTTDGARLAMIGPLPLIQADSFAAVYMEGIFRPGMQTRVHRHPGVEAWYTLEGEMCLESPWGRQVQKARGPGIMITGGQPMILTGTGTTTRRSLVLILQDATQPRSTHAPDWTPKGLCTS
jgi:quercetin dioxygenase-like cupin family protein